MKHLFILSLALLIQHSASSQFVAKMEVKEAIPGICNSKEVYVLFTMFKGQVEAICPVSKDSILNRLNTEVAYLRENPTHEDKGMVNAVINCKGEVVKCVMDNKTKNADLDKQIVAVFNSLGAWKAASLNDKQVDSSRLWSFEIKNGVISFK
jgi:hypothetical protein